MKTVTLIPGEELSHHSPHIQSRLLHNFNQARQTLRKATKQAKPVQIHPVEHLEMTPQMDTYSLLEPSAIKGS